MTEQLLILIGDYGGAALLVALAASCIGLPIPTSLLILAVGSLVAQGELEFWPFAITGIAGAVLGDQLGYMVGRLGSTPVQAQASRHRWLARGIDQATRFEARWGDAGVFFSRWLVSPLGPWVNLFAGMTGYSWRRFSLWAALGEVIWVSGYLTLGMAFSRSVETLAEMLGNLTWLAISLPVCLFLGWLLYRRRKARPAGRGSPAR